MNYKTYFLIWTFLPLNHLYADKFEVCRSCEFVTPAQAFEIVNPFDTIHISKGEYETIDLIIDKPIVILGDSGAILNGMDRGYIFILQADSITIDGLRLIGAGRSYTKDFAAIYVDRVDYFSIRNNIIENPFFGILVEKSHYGEIKGNNISGHSMREDDSGNGIHLWHCSNITIEGNEISHLRDGIYFEFVTYSTITKNYSHDNIRYGLHFMFSDHDNYIANQFVNNGAGVAVMFSKFIVMKENQFLKNWGTASYGLLLKEIYDAEVENNLFEENTMAIFVEGSTRINYLGNHFHRNGWAVKISGGCYANQFKGNNFSGNSFDVSYNTKLNDNSFNGNYWSEYSGYDLDKNGVGDVPHRPVKLFSYIVNRTPETIILLRSLFMDILNFSEKVSPVFTPDNLVDASPHMSMIN